MKIERRVFKVNKVGRCRTPLAKEMSKRNIQPIKVESFHDYAGKNADLKGRVYDDEGVEKIYKAPFPPYGRNGAKAANLKCMTDAAVIASLKAKVEAMEEELFNEAAKIVTEVEGYVSL